MYATRSNLALASADANDMGRLRSLLDLLRPGAGEPDLRGWEWRYLWQLGHEDRLTLRSQDDTFAAVAFSPDGQILAGLESKGRIQLWDRRTGKLLRTTGVLTQTRARICPAASVPSRSAPTATASPGPDRMRALRFTPSTVASSRCDLRAPPRRF